MLGKPFRWGAHGPDAWYCLGAHLELLRSAGIEVRDPFLEPTSDALLGFWRHFQRLPSLGDLRPLDALFWRFGGRPHVATVLEGPWALSVDETRGVERMPLPEALRLAEAAYRPRALL